MGSTLIANLKNLLRSRKEALALMDTVALFLMGMVALVLMGMVALVLMDMEALVMKVPTVASVVLVQLLNTNVSEHLKPSATLPHVQYHRSIARREMRKFVKS